MQRLQVPLLHLSLRELTKAMRNLCNVVRKPLSITVWVATQRDITDTAEWL